MPRSVDSCASGSVDSPQRAASAELSSGAGATVSMRASGTRRFRPSALPTRSVAAISSFVRIVPATFSGMSGSSSPSKETAPLLIITTLHSAQVPRSRSGSRHSGIATTASLPAAASAGATKTGEGPAAPAT